MLNPGARVPLSSVPTCRSYGPCDPHHPIHLSTKAAKYIHPNPNVAPWPHMTCSDAFFAAYNDTESVSRQPDAHDLDKGLQLQLHLEALDESVNAQMASKTFVPLTDVAVQNCLASLSWWTDKQQ